MQLARTIKIFQFQRNLSKTKRLLEALLSQEPTHENQSRVHYYQKDLSSRGLYANEYPNVFSSSRVDKITGLLEKASDYLVGSQFQKSGDQYPDRFLRHVSIGLELAQQLKQLIKN